YRDLRSDGSLVYSSVANGSAAPVQPTNTLRVGVTVTDATKVIYDRIICDAIENYGPPDILLGLPKPVASLVIVPAFDSIKVGTTRQFSATATFTDGSNGDVTRLCAWTSSAGAVASVSQGGLATALAAGVTNIGASVEGVVAPVAPLTVS